ncbi:MAG: T9SS type A sorting domain-containing protein, partial [Flavobacterium stagni]
LGTPSFALDHLQIKNPVGEQLEIFAPYAMHPSQMTISDALGKVIWTHDQTSFTGQLTLPLTLENGIYLLTIQNESGKSTYKLIKS